MKTKTTSLNTLSLLTIATTWLAGCAGTGLPKSRSEALPPPPAMSIVLLRLTASLDGKPADPFAGRTKVGFSITDLETGHGLAWSDPCPAGDAGFAKAGWAYLLLSPGDYRVTAAPLRPEYSDYKSITYRLSCRRPPIALRWLAPDHLWPADHLELRARGGACDCAIRIRGRRVFSLAKLQPADAFTSPRPLSQLKDLEIVTSSSEILEQPHWISRAARDYVKAAILPPGILSGVLFACDLAIMPVAAFAGTIAGNISQKQWAAHIPGLRQVLVIFHPATELATALFQQAQSNGLCPVRIAEAPQNLPAPVTTNTDNRILRGDLRAIRFVQGAERGLVGVEATLRFRILDAQADTNCLYDQEFPVISEFRNKKEYRGTPGQALFRTHLSGLINSGVGQFFNCVIPPPTPENEVELPTKP